MDEPRDNSKAGSGGDGSEPANALPPVWPEGHADLRQAGPQMTPHDPVNHPRHYTAHPSGVECIQITEHMGFTLGNAMKYIWRADLKAGVEDLKKARWYLDREIAKREASHGA